MYKQHSAALSDRDLATYAAPFVSVHEVEAQDMIAASTSSMSGGHMPGGDDGEIPGGGGHIGGDDDGEVVGAKGFDFSEAFDDIGHLWNSGGF